MSAPATATPSLGLNGCLASFRKRGANFSWGNASEDNYDYNTGLGKETLKFGYQDDSIGRIVNQKIPPFGEAAFYS